MTYRQKIIIFKILIIIKAILELDYFHRLAHIVKYSDRAIVLQFVLIPAIVLDTSALMNAKTSTSETEQFDA